MIALLRIAAVAVAGPALYEAGIVNGLVQLRPSPLGALFTTLAIAAAFVLLAMALTGTGRGDATAAAPDGYSLPMRATFLLVSVLAVVGLGWVRGVPAPPLHDPTPHHNDAIALNECAALLVLPGEDPYRRLHPLRRPGGGGGGGGPATPP